MRHIIAKFIGFGFNILSLFAPQKAADKAAKFFSTPVKPHVREKERVFLDSARQVRRSFGEQSIIEYHWGEEKAPLVLLSYGWSYNAGRWRYFVPRLVEAGYRVLAYDPPGHGLAPAGTLNIPLNAAIIRGLLEEYGPAHAIVGHSFGGTSSVYALQHLPEKLHPRRMVVMASFSYAPSVFKDFKNILGLWSPLYWRMVRGFEQKIGHSIERFDFAMMAGGFAHIEGLLIHDPKDSVTPYQEAKRYHDFWPGSHLFSPQSGGHHLGTKEITGTVIDFVQNGKLPTNAKIQERNITADHELVRFFAGL